MCTKSCSLLLLKVTRRSRAFLLVSSQDLAILDGGRLVGLVLRASGEVLNFVNNVHTLKNLAKHDLHQKQKVSPSAADVAGF